ncbi:hypothetical protein J2S97_001062 [Arthrobacter oryzae]|nr:hypothetical protein [Arthrobacter oryzae]
MRLEAHGCRPLPSGRSVVVPAPANCSTGGLRYYQGRLVPEQVETTRYARSAPGVRLGGSPHVSSGAHVQPTSRPGQMRRNRCSRNHWHLSPEAAWRPSPCRHSPPWRHSAIMVLGQLRGPFLVPVMITAAGLLILLGQCLVADFSGSAAWLSQHAKDKTSMFFYALGPRRRTSASKRCVVLHRSAGMDAPMTTPRFEMADGRGRALRRHPLCAKVQLLPGGKLSCGGTRSKSKLAARTGCP